ncbi:MAG TPA: type II secretion system F family protein [Candidatus Paceibacterota bacterium]|nr:type II secretion system F family protein [Candidatus Paceibacterota bacterium]
MKFRATIRKEGVPDEIRTLEAVSRFAVYEQIQKEEGTIVKLVETGGGLVLPSWLFVSFGTGIKHSEVSRLAKNIAAMLGAGLSLARALSVTERQSNNKHLKTLVSGLSESIKKGSSFHEALAGYPKVFSGLFIAMARAGEESGSLAGSLSTVGTQMERSDELVRKIRGAMIYPAIVISAVLIVGILMLIYVVPTLTSTFTQLGVQVPLATRIIVALSNFLVGNIPLVLGLLIVMVVGGTAFVRSKRGSNIILAISLHLPVINELIRETYAARAARTLSSLLASGVPVLEALSITKEVVQANAFAQVIDEAETHVRKGELLSASFAAHTKLYPILMSDMLAVGEETGNVTEMLKQVAEFYEADVAEKTKDLSTIIEPVLMLIIGAGVGVFAVAMIAPIYSLSSAF